MILQVTARNSFNETTVADNRADTQNFPRDERIVENHDKHRNVSGGDDAGVSCAEFAEHSVHELTEIARQGRRRASTDIHTAAWRGDLALVKVEFDVSSRMNLPVFVVGLVWEGKGRGGQRVTICLFFF